MPDQEPVSGETFDHVAQMNIVCAAARMLTMADLDKLLQTVERAESIGCFVMKPLEWQRGLGNLADQKELLNAAIGLRGAVTRIAKKRGLTANGAPAGAETQKGERL